MIERELTGLERRLYKFLDDMDFHLEYEPTKERWEVMRQKMKECKNDCKVSFGVICNGYSLHIELPFDVDKAMKEDESRKNEVKQLLMEIAKLKEESRWHNFCKEKPSEDMMGEEFIVNNGQYSTIAEWGEGHWENDPFCGSKICDEVVWWKYLDKCIKKAEACKG